MSNNFTKLPFYIFGWLRAEAGLRKERLRIKTIFLLQDIVQWLQTDEELLFDRVWPFLSPAEIKALQAAKGYGLIYLRKLYRTKYLNSEGRIKDGYFKNRGVD